MSGRSPRAASSAPLLREELDELYARYADYLDEGPLEVWPTLFAADAVYRVVTRENHDRGLPLAMILCEGRAAIEDRVYAIENTAFALPRRTRHLISGIRVKPSAAGQGDASQWDVTANFAIFETLEDRHSECHATGRYQDVVTREADAGLVFSSKLAICDSALVPNSLVTPL